MMTITYPVHNGLYINLTNRCPCACTFCLRQNGAGIFGSDSLWLDHEPSVEEVKAALDARDLTTFDEVVFCGYGEPTERLEVLLAVAEEVKARRPGMRVRVNTNGLSDLIHGRATAADFAGRVDCLSISLNTDDPAEYLSVCRPKFGDAAYPALLKFAEEAARHVPEVVLTVVGEPVTSLEKQERCREICRRLGVTLRVRKFES